MADLCWEVLVVDNNSTDATPEEARRFEGVLPIRYVFEPTQGLSAARNRALETSRGELLIFTDDDVLLDSAWLAAFAEASLDFRDAGFFGGRIQSSWPDQRPPRWLINPTLDLISGLLVYYDLGTSNRMYTAADPLPFGASFALRRSLAAEVGAFRLDLGVNGVQIGRGEETEYIERSIKAGFGGAYVGQALCLHVQDPARLRLAHLLRYGVESGVAVKRAGLNQRGTLAKELAFYLKGLAQLLKGRGDHFRQCIINAGIQRGLRRASRR